MKKDVPSEPMCSKVMLTSRLLVAAIFVMSAYGKITGFTAQAVFAGSSWLALPGELLLGAAILMEVFGAIALISGWRYNLGVKVLIFYTIMTTIMFHIGEGQAMNLLKNLAIIGGLLAMTLLKPGKYSYNGKEE